MTRTILVTGAASGIGAAVTAHLQKDGADVISLDLREPAMAVRRHISCDLSDSRTIDAALEALAPESLDGLCNVAGVPGTLPADVVLKVNLLGLRKLTEGVIGQLVSGSAIVHVASTAGFQWPDRLAEIRELLATTSFEAGAAWYAENAPECPAYHFSKEALIVYTMMTSFELRHRGIRVNSVSPGPVETPILPDFESSMGADVIGGVRAVVGRHGSPEDIAPVVEFLLDPSSGWINGANLIADGGFMAGLMSGAIPVPVVE